MSLSEIQGDDLRERGHLDPFFKAECERHLGARPVARTLRSKDFPRLGPVDVVLERPRALIELKWAHGAPAKIFEGLWDALKLALLGPAHGYDALYLVTGASRGQWSNSESADLFRTGEVDTLEAWNRALVPRRGPNYGATVGEDLVIGAHGNRPLRAHPTLAVQTVTASAVADDYELRAVRISGVGSVIRWPTPEATPASPVTGGDLASVTLPPRVTQAWIEGTAPRLTSAAVEPFLRALRERGWSETDLAVRVRPHLPS
ncbi:hypothetical protein C8N24_0674 [Solirubrobacter pauli]|uniref:Uncharacterized protein n=2 Tax=Solirubrobacter pauli TaxID=166793 RepID=A0A660L8L9_9ACTN|nr:hypothetical protein C8N24_0674 [Solirubrobacter pauli]